MYELYSNNRHFQVDVVNCSIHSQIIRKLGNEQNRVPWIQQVTTIHSSLRYIDTGRYGRYTHTDCKCNITVVVTVYTTIANS